MDVDDDQKTRSNSEQDGHEDENPDGDEDENPTNFNQLLRNNLDGFADPPPQNEKMWKKKFQKLPRRAQPCDDEVYGHEYWEGINSRLPKLDRRRDSLFDFSFVGKCKGV